MRTVVEWFNLYMEDDRLLFESACVNFINCSNVDMKLPVKRMSDAINSFRWPDTPEGDHFWYNVYMFYARFDNPIIYNSILLDEFDDVEEHTLYESLHELINDSIVLFSMTIEQPSNIKDTSSESKESSK